MINTPIEEILVSEAEFGNFHAQAKISKNIVLSLREKGLTVVDYDCVNYFPRFHRINWEHAEVKGNIESLDENNPEFTFAQKLWIITKKNHK